MIFTSLGLILVGVGFLIAGIAKSSVALLMVSLMLTIASGVVLVLVAGAARRLVAAGAGAGPVAGQGDVVYVPMPAASAAPVPADGNGAGVPPLVGYDDMTAEQVVRLVRSGGLGPEQLDAIVTYEELHQQRKTVVDAVNRQTSRRVR